MKLTSTKAVSKYVNFLIHGKHGIGKTPLIATAPKPFIIDLDGGQMSNKDLDLPVSEVRCFEELEETYAYLNTKKSKKTFETVIMDGGWELSDMVLEALKDEIRKDAKAAGKGAEPRRAYMQLAEVYKLWIRKFKELPYNFGLTTLSTTYEISETVKYYAHFSGNVLKTELPGMFNEIFCLHYTDEDEDDGKIVLQCKPCSDYDCRDRSNSLKKFEKFDLTYLFNKIQKGNSKNGKK